MRHITRYGCIINDATSYWSAGNGKSLKGIDSLLSIIRMPGGIPVATTAIGAAGAKNAGILAARMLSIQNPSLVEKLNQYESSLIQKVEDMQNELQ